MSRIRSIQVHTTVARKERPRTASSRPTLNVNRGSRPLSLRTVHAHATDTRARAGHPHALALDPTAAVRVRPARARPRAPRTATRRVLGGLEPPSRAPPRPLQHARSTSSTRARKVADGDGAALDHREGAAKSPAALAEEVVGLLRTCEGKGGKQRRSAGRTRSVRPRRPAATTTSLWRLQAPLREMILAGTHCRALLRIALHNELNMMPSVEAEACAALSNADAATAEWQTTTAAINSSLLKAVEQADHDAEGAARSAAQMTARMPATARRSREDAVKWRPRATTMTLARSFALLLLLPSVFLEGGVTKSERLPVTPGGWGGKNYLPV